MISSSVENYRNEIQHGISENIREARRSVSESPHRSSLRPKEKNRSVNLSQDSSRADPCGRSFHSCSTPFCSTKAVCRCSSHLPLYPTWYHLGAAWRAIDLLEVEGTRRRTLPARSSRYACAARAYGFALASRTNCQFHRQADCTWDREILVTVIIRDINRVRQLNGTH